MDQHNKDNNEEEEKALRASIQNPNVAEENRANTPSSSVQTIRPMQVYRRTRLPTMIRHNLSIWSLLKASVGKDLMRVSMPLEIFEPLGILQVFCEELEYSHLLDKAVLEPDVFKRMAYIASFAVSRYASTLTRAHGKPFNPLEGETYECVRNDLGWRFVAEQVRQHPAISACYAEGNGWKWWQSACFDMSFWGNSIHAKPITPVDVLLKRINGDAEFRYKEAYRWNKVTTNVHNLVLGKPYLDHHGDMTVKCSNRVTCKLHFSKSTKVVSGNILDSKGVAKHKIKGTWCEYLNFDNERIWTANRMPPHANEQYGFGNFQVSLNEITDDIKGFLPPTDTRFRPDQRLLEDGKLEEGKVHKSRLENEQRARRKIRTYVPKWFTDKTPNGQKNTVMHFNQRYWNARASHFAGEEFDNLW